MQGEAAGDAASCKSRNKRVVAIVRDIFGPGPSRSALDEIRNLNAISIEQLSWSLTEWNVSLIAREAQPRRRVLILPTTLVPS